jgi:hypothetical protein
MLLFHREAFGGTQRDRPLDHGVRIRDDQIDLYRAG